MSRHRRCIVLRGTPEATRAEADRLVRAVDHVLHVRSRASTRALLGSAFDAVVLDLHDGIDADLLGLCHGFVRGGGALILRMPDVTPPGDARLAVPPYARADVGTRFWRRFERCLERSADPPEPLAPVPQHTAGNAAQDRVVDALADVLLTGAPSIAALTADRGRGKSSALGLAVRRATARSPLRIAVTADHVRSVAEVLRFAGDSPIFVPPAALALGAAYDVILVDEAAQLPVPLLRRIVRANPTARMAFATTTRGYEGTGRGFVLRFLAWLEGQERPVRTLTLDAPIRWEAGDPLERFVFEALALDAEPADHVSEHPLEHAILDRDRLAGDERLLRDVFGLLVHAHYRTTPSDLHRLLDAPNLDVHVLTCEGRVAAASVVAREGGLAPDTIARVASGAERIRGHALADTLICHAGRAEAGGFEIVRSMRIAVHPKLRGRGLGKRLVGHVHGAYAPDLFGTVFGATPELLRFRRSTGYELVRVGGSRGERTGEPAAVMIRPCAPRAKALVASLRQDLARELPVQLALLEADGGLPLDPELVEALRSGLPEPAALTDDAQRAIVEGWAFGPRSYEAAALAVEALVASHPEQVAALDPAARALIRARVTQRLGWREAARAADMDSVPTAMRALRRAIRDLLAAHPA